MSYLIRGTARWRLHFMTPADVLTPAQQTSGASNPSMRMALRSVYSNFVKSTVSPPARVEICW